MASREPALTDDMRAAVALRHINARDRARGNVAGYVREWERAHTPQEEGRSRSWALWWQSKASEHEADARAILPPADSWIEQDWPAPAFVGGAT
jgi:hypothetical protein